MRRYLRLIVIFYKNTLINEMEYRLNFLANIVLSLFWLAWAALSVRVYFTHTEHVAGWSYLELLIVMGLFFMINGFRQVFLQENLSRLSEYVRMGTLDFILTKPVDSQFLVSLRRIGVYNWGDPLLGLGLVIYALWRMGRVPSPVEVGMFLILLAAGMLALYSFNLIIQTTTFWFTNIEEADDLIEGILTTGRFPVSFYRGWLRGLLTVVVPVAFMTTFPAQALLGRLDGRVVLAAVGLAALLFLLAAWFWRFGLRHYVGASS